MNSTTLPQGVLLDRFPASVGMFIFCTLGIFGNVNIIYASFRNKSLRTHCHILIALNALCDTLTMIGLYLPIFLTLSGINYMKLDVCWFIEAIPYFGMNAAVIFTLTIGIDRLYSVLTPLRYNKAQRSFYLTSMILLPVLYALSWIVLSCLAMVRQPDTPVVCGVTTLVAASLSQYNFIATIVISVVVLIVYTGTWITAKKLGSKMTGQLLKPLTIIMVIVTLTYPMSYVLLAIINVVVPPANIVTFRMSTGVLMTFGYACHYFVYYHFSRDYKSTFRKQLGWLKKSWASAHVLPVTSRHSHTPSVRTRSSEPKSNISIHVN